MARLSHFYQGVPRVVLYDNLRSAVLERIGNAIRFHPTLLELAKHYRFEPRPVAVARGNEKGRVERAIRYVRDSFFAARTWVSVDDLNRQAAEWSCGLAAERRWQQDGTRRVGEVFAEERTRLLPHPEHDFVTDERVEVDVGKAPNVRFDLNERCQPGQHHLSAANDPRCHAATELEAAVAQAVARATPHVGAVRQLLELQRVAQGRPPAAIHRLVSDPCAAHVVVQPHDLSQYDRIHQERDHEDQ